MSEDTSDSPEHVVPDIVAEGVVDLLEMVNICLLYTSAWGDSAPTWIYGGGDLWLYESDNPGGVDLMRISARTGEVLQRLRVPKVWHPVLAYNDEGLWVAPSGQSGSSELYLCLLYTSRCV